MISDRKLKEILTHEGLTKDEDNETLISFTNGNLRISLLKKNKYDNKFEVYFKNDGYIPEGKQATHSSSLSYALAKMLSIISIEQFSTQDRHTYEWTKDGYPGKRTEERLDALYIKERLLRKLIIAFDVTA